MKNFKILIICLLIIFGVIPAVYAYWTDTVNSKINVTLTYDGYLNVLNFPEPVPVPEPAAEEVPLNGDIPAAEHKEEEKLDSENPGGGDDGEINDESLQKASVKTYRVKM